MIPVIKDSHSIVLERQGEEFFTTTLALAEGTQNDPASVFRLVKKYKADLEEFGDVRFEIRLAQIGGKTKPIDVALLNESQATLILMYLRNNEIVVAFKTRLVRAFFEMRAQQGVAMQDMKDPEKLRALLLGGMFPELKKGGDHGCAA